jgi:hypothetical protein
VSETADCPFSCASMAGGAFVVTGLSAAFLAYTRSVCAAYFCGAALGCALSVKVIKKFVRQPRPLGVTRLESYGYELYHRLCLRQPLGENLKPFFCVLIVCLARTRPSCSSTLARWSLRRLRCPSTLHSPITRHSCVAPGPAAVHLPLWSLFLGSGGATTISSKSQLGVCMGRVFLHCVRGVDRWAGCIRPLVRKMARRFHGMALTIPTVSEIEL